MQCLCAVVNQRQSVRSNTLWGFLYIFLVVLTVEYTLQLFVCIATVGFSECVCEGTCSTISDWSVSLHHGLLVSHSSCTQTQHQSWNTCVIYFYLVFLILWCVCLQPVCLFVVLYINSYVMVSQISFSLSSDQRFLVSPSEVWKLCIHSVQRYLYRSGIHV